MDRWWLKYWGTVALAIMAIALMVYLIYGKLTNPHRPIRKITELGQAAGHRACPRAAPVDCLPGDSGAARINHE